MPCINNTSMSAHHCNADTAADILYSNQQPAVNTRAYAVTHLTAWCVRTVGYVQAEAYVQQNVGELLQPIAAAISKAKSKQSFRSLQETNQAAAALELALAQARSICSLAGQQGLNQQAAAVLSIPHVPQELAQITQQAGLQLSTVQLVAAARARVAGLQSWVVEPYCEGLDPLVPAVLSGDKVGVSSASACLTALS
jgi:hypothetical protein